MLNPHRGETALLAGKKILLVEDNPVTVAFFVKAFTRSGAELVTVRTVDAARQAVSPELSLAIIDINLGDGGTGTDLLPCLRSAGVTTVVCTASDWPAPPSGVHVWSKAALGLNLLSRVVALLANRRHDRG